MVELILNSVSCFAVDMTVLELGPVFILTGLEQIRRSSIGTPFSLLITGLLVATILAKESKLLM